MNKAERVQTLIWREAPNLADRVTVTELLELCEFLPSESPRAIAMRVLDYLNS